MPTLPFVTAICPTYRHPKLLSNSLALWLGQDYPLDRREMIILDDGQSFMTQQGPGFTLWSYPERLPSLAAKHNELLKLVPDYTDVILIWDDDEIFLPGYIQWHIAALETSDFSKPSYIYSDYGRSARGSVKRESAAGRFHSSLAFTKKLVEKVGGWEETLAADFDQRFIQKMIRSVPKVGDPCQYGPIQFVYSWETGDTHCSSLMRSPRDEAWYAAHGARSKDVFVGTLSPEYDRRTIDIYWELGAQVKELAA